MNKFLKILSLVGLLLCQQAAFSFDFWADGVFYYITDESAHTVAVCNSSVLDGTSPDAQSYEGNVSIPAQVTDSRTGTIYNVTSIGAYAFYGCESLTSVEMAGNILSIDRSAFQNCTNLTSVALSDNLNTISPFAFHNCASLASISIPAATNNIGAASLSKCENLEITIDPANPRYSAEGNVIYDKAQTRVYGISAKETSISLPSTVTSIDPYAFAYSTRLQTVDIPNSVTSIGTYAFGKCTALSSITIPSGLSTIEAYTFTSCKQLTTADLPTGLTSIEMNAFDSCSLLANVSIPTSVTKVGDFAFHECDKLPSVNIHAGLTNIGNAAFAGCDILDITVDAANPNYSADDNVIYNKEKTSVVCISAKNTSVNFPGTVTSIAPYGASYCSRLNNVVLPNSITQIGSHAFYYDIRLSNITLSDNTERIDSYAFAECKRLSELTLPEALIDIENNAFYNCILLETLYNCSDLVLTMGSEEYGQVARYALEILECPYTPSAELNYAWKTLLGTETYKTLTEIRVVVNAPLLPAGSHVETPDSSAIIATVDGTVLTLTTLRDQIFLPVNSDRLFAEVGGINNIAIIDLSHFNTERVKKMEYMFDGCQVLSLNLSNFVTENVTSVSGMFNGCMQLGSIDLSKFDLAKVANISNLFNLCNALTTIKTPKLFPTAALTCSLPDHSATSESWRVNGVGSTTYTDMLLAPKQAKLILTEDLPDKVYFPERTEFTSILTSIGSSYSKVKQIVILTNQEVMSPLEFSVSSGILTVKTPASEVYLPPYCYKLFYGCKVLQNFDFTQFNTSEVENMSYMFYGCTALQSVNLTGKSISTATSMSFMFSGCKALTSISMAGQDLANVTTCASMFQNCENLTDVDLSGMNLPSVTTTATMFRNCSRLTNVQLGSSLNTTALKYMNGMFKGCTSLSSIDMAAFNTNKVQKLDSLFKDCAVLTAVDFSTNTAYSTIYAKEMFENCAELATINLTFGGATKTSYLRNMARMFHNCAKLESIDLSKFSLKYDTLTTHYEDALTGTTSLAEMYAPAAMPRTPQTLLLPNDGMDGKHWYEIDQYGYTTTQRTNLFEAKVKSHLLLTDYNPKAVFPPYKEFRAILDELSGDTLTHTTITEIQVAVETGTEVLHFELDGTILRVTTICDQIFLPANCTYLFGNMGQLLSIDLSHFNTSDVTSMYRMFYYDSKLPSLDLSGFNTSKVTNMSYLFYHCSKLPTIDISGFDFGKVTTIAYMYGYCSAMEELDLSMFNFPADKTIKTESLITQSLNLTTIHTPTSFGTPSSIEALPNSGKDNHYWFEVDSEGNIIDPTKPLTTLMEAPLASTIMWKEYAVSTGDIQASLFAIEKNNLIISSTDDKITQASLIINNLLKTAPSKIVALGGDLYLFPVSSLSSYKNKEATLTTTIDGTIYSHKFLLPNITASNAVSDKYYTAARNAVVTADTLTINGTAKAHRIDIMPQGTILINGTLQADSIVLHGGYSFSTYDKVEATGPFAYPNIVVSSTGSIDGSPVIVFDFTTHAKSYQLLSLPESASFDDLTTETGSTSFSASVKYYDGAKRATTQAAGNWVKATSIEAGVGYEMVAKPTGERPLAIVRFPLSLSAFTTSRTVPVGNYGVGSTIAENHIGWNLIGMPHFGLVDHLYIEESNGTTTDLLYVVEALPDGVYRHVQTSDYVFSPFKAFMIQAPVAGDLHFANTASPAPSRSAVAPSARTINEFLLTSADGTMEDNAGLLIGDQYTHAYELGADLNKETSTGLQVYTLQDGQKRAYNALAAHLATLIPVGIKVPAEGEYIFRIDPRHMANMGHLYLTDHNLGITTDLLTEEYAFTTQAGTNDSRFTIQWLAQSADIASDLDNQSGMQIATNGNLLILTQLPAGATVRTYDALGRLMQTATTSEGQLQLIMPNGVYMIVATSGNQQFVQKCIIK